MYPFSETCPKGLLIVRDAEESTRREPLIILRLLHALARTGAGCERDTAAAVRKNARLCRALSADELREWLFSVLTQEFCGSVMCRFGGVFADIFPELAPMYRFEQQNRHHVFDVWTHTAVALDGVPGELRLRLAMLLHDCGKPAVCYEEDGERHFDGHVEKSADIARGFLSRLGADEALTRDVCALILCHDMRLDPTPENAARMRALLGENARYICAVQRADNLAQSPRFSRLGDIDALEKLIFKILP